MSRQRKILSYNQPQGESAFMLRMGVWGSILVVGLFMTWAYYAEIDQITRAQGQIIPSSRTQIIQAPDGGVIEKLLVREGAEVDRGELLVRFDRTKAEASYREAEFKVAGLSATVARLRSEVFGGEPIFKPETLLFPEFRQNQTDLLRKRRESLESEIRAIERMKVLAQRELVDVIFEQPYCRIGNLVEKNIAQRQSASRYLKELATIGVLREVQAGKEKLFIHPKLMQLLGRDGNEFTPYD